MGGCIVWKVYSMEKSVTSSNANQNHNAGVGRGEGAVQEVGLSLRRLSLTTAARLDSGGRLTRPACALPQGGGNRGGFPTEGLREPRDPVDFPQSPVQTRVHLASDPRALSAPSRR